MTTIPVTIAEGLVYSINAPMPKNSKFNLTTTCGTIFQPSNDSITISTSPQLQGGTDCEIAIGGKICLVQVTSAAIMWSDELYLPKAIAHLAITVKIGTSIDPIILPKPSSFVNDVASVPDIVFASHPALPDGLSLVGGVISGSLVSDGSFTVEIYAIATASQLSLSLGTYTFVAETETAPSKMQSIASGNIAGITIGIILGTAVILLVVLLMRARRHPNKPFDFTSMVEAESLELSGERFVPRELHRVHVTIEHALGKGNFGEVFKGTFDDVNGGRVFDVAIKSLLPTDTAEDSRSRFLEEAVMMAQFDHRNVTQLIGVVTLGDPALLVMEYCALGSLESYLQSAEMENHTKVLIAIDCAAGMSYLASRKFIHRDLAARNVLLTADLRAKISDFGMSREANNKEYYTSHGGQLPVRWTAPEALDDRRFSEKTDVWSYGILLYEIWTKGALPYKGWRNEKVWVQVAGGFRLPRPNGCHDVIYEVMMSCWDEPDERPTFDDLLGTLTMIGGTLGIDETLVFLRNSSQASRFSGSVKLNSIKKPDTESVFWHAHGRRSTAVLLYEIPDVPPKRSIYILNRQTGPNLNMVTKEGVEENFDSNYDEITAIFDPHSHQTFAAMRSSAYIDMEL